MVLAKLGDPLGDPGSYHTALGLIAQWDLVEAAPYLHAYIHTPELPYRTVIETAQTLSVLGDLTEKDLPPIMTLVQAAKIADNDLARVFRGVTPPEAAIPHLMEAFEGGSSESKATIAKALAHIGEPAYPYVIPMLEEHPNIREAVVTTLSYQDYTVIAPLMSFAAQAERPVVQEAVTSIVSKVSDHEFEDLEACQEWWQELEGQMNGLQPDDFAAALASDEIVLRRYTLEQIVELGPSAADLLPVLTDMLHHTQSEQFWVTMALGAIEPEGLETINDYLGHNTSNVSMIYLALGVMGPDALDSVPVLISNLAQQDICERGTPVYPATVHALTMITGQHLGCDASAWQAWWDANK
jgi:hypothetical protein